MILHSVPHLHTHDAPPVGGLRVRKAGLYGHGKPHLRLSGRQELSNAYFLMNLSQNAISYFMLDLQENATMPGLRRGDERNCTCRECYTETKSERNVAGFTIRRAVFCLSSRVYCMPALL